MLKLLLIRQRFSVSSGMMVLFVLLLASLFSSVHTTLSQRYGGIKRPVSAHFSFVRPNAFHHQQPGAAIPSPTHAYPIFSRPNHPQGLPYHQPPPIRFPNQGIQFQPQQQQLQQYGSAPTYIQGLSSAPTSVQQLGQHSSSYLTPQQTTQQIASYQPQSSVNYGHTLTNSIYQPPASAPSSPPAGSSTYYAPQATQALSNPMTYATNSLANNPLYSTSSSSSHYSYYPAHSYYSIQSVNPRPTQHFHVKPGGVYDASGTHNVPVTAYEPCTSSHWQPILSASASTISQTQSQPPYFYGGSVSTVPRPKPSYFRYQPESSNKVVVLSHEVLKTILANSRAQKSTKSEVGTKGVVDNVVSASQPVSSTIVGNAVEQPSVKLVGYIGPTSDNTPTGYLQIPISKEMMETLSGSGSNYDFAVNSSSYSLFTMKSVNDVQSLLGVLKSEDNEASASQNIPLGLVVSADAVKPQEDQLKASSSITSGTMFYPVESSSAANGGSANGGNGDSNPSIQMVGHVQITSPDVSTHFNKRHDVAVSS